MVPLIWGNNPISGCFRTSAIARDRNAPQGQDFGSTWTDLNASWSNEIYINNGTVLPSSIQVNVIIHS